MEKRFIGNENQLLTARRVTYTEGLSKGVQAIELRNGLGLYATCVEDQCLNLFDFSYKGINFAFQAKNGLVSGRYFNGGAPEFNYYWPAGMMYTCGLLNVLKTTSDPIVFRRVMQMHDQALYAFILLLYSIC